MQGPPSRVPAIAIASPTTSTTSTTSRAPMSPLETSSQAFSSTNSSPISSGSTSSRSTSSAAMDHPFEFVPPRIPLAPVQPQISPSTSQNTATATPSKRVNRIPLTPVQLQPQIPPSTNQNTATATPSKRVNHDQAPPPKRVCTDWKTVKLQSNTSGNMTLYNRQVRVHEFNVKEQKRKTEQEFRDETGRSADTLLLVSRANSVGMDTYGGGDIVNEADMSAPPLSWLTDSACEHCTRGRRKNNCKFSTGWLAACDHCALNGRSCILMVIEEDDVVWNVLGTVDVRTLAI